MGYNYYGSNGKKKGYSGKDIWGNNCLYGTDGKKKSMSRGFSRCGADAITRNYNSNGVMTGYSWKRGDGITHHYNKYGVMTGYSQKCGDGIIRQFNKEGVVNDDDFLRIELEVERLLKEKIGEGGYIGFCHVYWRAKKQLLKEKYGIDWITPAERNPHILFD